MKWQDLLTKKQMAHLRWSMNGAAPTLGGFIELRKAQKEMEETREEMGLLVPVCVECREIEARLRRGGKL